MPVLFCKLFPSLWNIYRFLSEIKSRNHPHIEHLKSIKVCQGLISSLENRQYIKAIEIKLLRWQHLFISREGEEKQCLFLASVPNFYLIWWWSNIYLCWILLESWTSYFSKYLLLKLFYINACVVHHCLNCQLRSLTWWSLLIYLIVLMSTVLLRYSAVWLCHCLTDMLV